MAVSRATFRAHVLPLAALLALGALDSGCSSRKRGAIDTGTGCAPGTTKVGTECKAGTNTSTYQQTTERPVGPGPTETAQGEQTSTTVVTSTDTSTSTDPLVVTSSATGQGTSTVAQTRTNTQQNTSPIQTSPQTQTAAQTATGTGTGTGTGTLSGTSTGTATATAQNVNLGAAVTFNNAPSVAVDGAPHVKLIATIQDRKLLAHAALSHKENVSEFRFTYGKSAWRVTGDPKDKTFEGKEVALPVTLTFTFNGKKCTLTTEAGFVERTHTPKCD